MNHQCRECGKFFRAIGPFDLHRIGKHGIDRRCMTTDEMIQAGLRCIDGVWRGQPPDKPIVFQSRIPRKSTQSDDPLPQ